MIIDFLINVLLGGIPIMINSLPTFALPTDLVNGVNNFLSSIGQFNSIFPITSIIAGLGIILAFHGFTFAWYMINWLIRKIPTVS